MSAHERLRRSERLKSKKTIDQLFRKGRRVKNARVRILYLLEEGNGELRVAFAVPKKKVKKAHDRNRVRRLMKESFRSKKGELAQVLAAKKKKGEFFILYQGRELPSFQEMEEEISAAMERLKGSLAA